MLISWQLQSQQTFWALGEKCIWWSMVEIMGLWQKKYL
jgi:hypothetical protein